jgi:hypothetical protein
LECLLPFDPVISARRVRLPHIGVNLKNIAAILKACDPG